MGKAAQSERAVLEQLEAVKELLMSIERQLSASGSQEDQSTRPAPESVAPETVTDTLAYFVREAGEQVIERIQSVEARLDAAERSLAEKDMKELQHELFMREVAKAGPARKIPTMKAPPDSGASPPIDYTPVINTAVHALREIAEYFLRGKQQPTTPPPGTGT